MVTTDALLHLLVLLLILFPLSVGVGSLGVAAVLIRFRVFFLTFIARIGFRDRDETMRAVADTKRRIVEHGDGELHRFRTEID